MTKVLVACEYSGIVRDAFRKKGYDAYSCDLRETESDPDYHFREDVFKTLDRKDWDLMIAHPPCTYLCNSGVRWLHEKQDRWQKMVDGAVFFRKLLNADVPRIAVENPIMHKYAKKVAGVQNEEPQTIQPYQFGEPESKAICLWTRNLPELEKTDVVEEREHRVHNMGPSDDRSKERSRFFEGRRRCHGRPVGKHPLNILLPLLFVTYDRRRLYFMSKL